jgi:hypothetical protein
MLNHPRIPQFFILLSVSYLCTITSRLIITFLFSKNYYWNFKNVQKEIVCLHLCHSYYIMIRWPGIQAASIYHYGCLNQAVIKLIIFSWLSCFTLILFLNCLGFGHDPIFAKTSPRRIQNQRHESNYVQFCIFEPISIRSSCLDVIRRVVMGLLEGACAT